MIVRSFSGHFDLSTVMKIPFFDVFEPDEHRGVITLGHTSLATRQIVLTVNRPEWWIATHTSRWPIRRTNRRDGANSLLKKGANRRFYPKLGLEDARRLAIW